MLFKMLARIGEYDVELAWDDQEIDNLTSLVNLISSSHPEIKPRPRFQNNAPKVEMPFVGTVESTELIPAKDGKREYCLAHMKHEDGTVIPVRYFPPLKTWKAGEKATVQKGQYGPELKELDSNEPPF